MVEFDAKKISEGELIEAANKIFTIQEADFKKIQSEKWYETLFHAITLNQDGKKYVVRGINSLAKLQQLFMEIYVKNYRKTHEQLDAVIEAVTQNSVAIRKLYGMCVLDIEEQESLESLDSYDKDILALFLGEYRDENGSVPALVQNYNRGVKSALNIESPKGNLDNHQIRRLKAPKVVYRCFMEQCMVDGTIDTQEWTDKIYEDLKDFELSENSKNEIKESVKNEAEIAGTEYFIIKYSKNNAGVLDIDFEIDIEASIGKRYTHELSNECTIELDLSEIRTILEWASDRVVYTKGLNITYFLDVVKNQEVKTLIDNGECNSTFLTKKIRESLSTENGFSYVFRLSDDCCTDFEKHLEDKPFVFVFNIDGVYYIANDKIAFIDYLSLKSVKQDLFTKSEYSSTYFYSSLTIFAERIHWYSLDGTEVVGENFIDIQTLDLYCENYSANCFLLKEDHYNMRVLRRLFDKILNSLGKNIEPKSERIKAIICNNLIKMAGSGKGYNTSDLKEFKDTKRLLNAISRHSGIKKEDVVAFIDTSLLKSGKSGVVFTYDGIAFDYAFRPVYVKYEDIEFVDVVTHVRLSGCFGLMYDYGDGYTVDGYEIIDYSVDAASIRQCLEQILCII